MGAITLKQKLESSGQDSVARLLGCSQPWISRIARGVARPSMDLILRAKEVWPGLDVRASEEEYMTLDELCARRGRELARYILTFGDHAAISLGSVALERLRSGATEILGVGRG